jgi:hypothetical protein
MDSDVMAATVGLSYGDDERLRVGDVTGGRSRFSKVRLGYRVNGRKSSVNWAVLITSNFYKVLIMSNFCLIFV